jgi:hypothetical protein
MGAVYLVHDRHLDVNVALKLLPEIDPSALYRFKNEFRALAELVHPNLVALYELMYEGGQWFFTMEYVPGLDFHSYITVHREAPAPLAEAGSNTPTTLADEHSTLGTGFSPDAPEFRFQARGRFDEGRLRHAFRQLAEGVHALHCAGKLHRDIKPSNVMVRPDGTVVVLDFGLITELAVRPQADPSRSQAPGRRTAAVWSAGSQSLSGEIVGTISHMAPEQAAGGELSRASDWYAVGVMLYTELAGRRPFAGSKGDVLGKKQSEDPPPPSSVADSVPGDLDRLCMELLRRDPKRRPGYQRVVSVLEGAAGLSSGGAAASAAARAVGPDADEFVGRAPQLELLHQAYRKMLGGNLVTAAAHGPSGMGKSTLLQHFFQNLPPDDSTVVLTGRCHAQESVPFKTLDNLVDSLCRYLHSLPENECLALLPRHVGELARLFPVLNQVAAIRRTPAPPVDARQARESRQRAFTSFVELLARIGDRRPLVLQIEDLQWGDADSVDALHEFILARGALRMLLVLSFREEHVLAPEYARLLKTMQEATPAGAHVDVHVGPLSEAESRILAQQILGDGAVSDERVAEIVREAEGNPLFVQELAFDMREMLSRRLPAAGSGLTETIRRRVAALPAPSRTMLETLAVAGKPTRLRDLLRAIPDLVEPLRLVVALRAVRLVRTAGPLPDDSIEVFHDRIRETINAGLGAELRTSYHRQLATALAAAADTDPETLAQHFEGAGELSSAGQWYARAAEQADQALAFGHAAALYARALDLGQATGAAESPLRRAYAQALANAGRGQLAAAEYLRVAESAPADQRRNLQGLAATQLCISGHIDEGLKIFQSVLGAYRLRLRRGRWGVLSDLLQQRFLLWLRGTRFHPRPPEEVPRDDLDRIDTLWSVSAGLSTANNLSAAALQTYVLREALRVGDAYRVARSLAWEAFLVGATAGERNPRADRLLAEARQIADCIAHPHAHAMVTLSQGLLEFQRARFPQCTATLTDAEQQLLDHCTGVWWELAALRWIRGTALWHSGELVRLADFSTRHFREASERGDLFTMTNMQASLLPYLRLARGAADEAQELVNQSRQNWNHSGFHYQHLQSMFLQAQIHLFRGEGWAAWECVASAWPAMKRALVLHNQIVRVMMLDFRATCALAAAAARRDQRERMQRLAARDAQALAHDRDDWSWTFACRIRGGLALAQSQPRVALAHFQAAAAGFDRRHMKIHAASVRFLLGGLEGCSDGPALRQAAEQVLRAEGVTIPDRFCAMHTWG